MHTASIRQTGTDAAGRYLVTGSADKTARVWDLVSGALLRTLRPPIGPGTEGEIYAVALSPDGSLIAIGGDTAGIYLFDRASGQMVRRIGGLPHAVSHLVFSRDGSRLAAGLAQGGLRVFGVQNVEEQRSDGACTGSTHGADFDHDGRLLAACSDGLVRLYDPSLTLKARWTSPEGQVPHSVRFSPDGKKVAVGYENSPQVDVLSAAALRLLYRPDVKGVDKGLGVVAWSIDGKLLYATGEWDAGGGHPIRRWDREGQGAFLDVRTSQDRIEDLAALPRGQMAFGSQGPGWGIVSMEGKRGRSQDANVADLRGLGAGLRLDATGTRVRFAYQRGGQIPAQFSVSDQVLAVSQVPPPDDKIWTSRLAAEGPGHIRADAAVLAVSLSADGKLAVAALGDGTLRWYRAADGRELLAFLPHSDRKRWALWTPSGYYAAAPGGEDLLGWHKNQGTSLESDFFRGALLREHLHRPDVIARVLRTLDEERAVGEANAAAGHNVPVIPVAQLLPPVVTLRSPAEGTLFNRGEVTVRAVVRSPSGEPVIKVYPMVNGKMLPQGRGVMIGKADPGQVRARPGEVEYSLTVSLPQDDCTVAVVAETALSRSEPVVVHLRWAGQSFNVQPKLYVLAVGVSKYRKIELRLDYPAKDAGDLVAELRKQQGRLYREVEARVLADRDATKDNILDGLEWLQRQTTAKDVAMLFLAGHGIMTPNTGDYYYLPYDADMQAIKRTMLFGGEVQSTLKSITGKVLLFLDTCHAGNVMGPGLMRGGTDPARFVSELSSAENGVVVFASSTGRQASKESPLWRNGAFTRALVEGLRGRAAYDRTHRVTVNMLDLYLSERVKELTDGLQTPTTAKPALLPDFPVAIGDENPRALPIYALPKPLYKRWWFWGALGTVVAGAVITGAVLGTRSTSPCAGAAVADCQPILNPLWSTP